MAGGLLEGAVNASTFVMLPRSKAFVACRNSPEVQDVFPPPIDQWVWSKFSNSEGPEPLTLFTAVPKVVVEQETEKGICLRFVVCWKWLKMSRPDLMMNATVAMVDRLECDTELTIIHNGFPLFCRSCSGPPQDISREIENTLSYLRRAHSFPLIEVSEIIDVPSDEIIDPNILDVPWIVRPEIPVSPLTRLWRRNKDNALSATAAALVLASLALRQSIDAGQIQLSQWKQEIKRNNTAAQASGREVLPGQALRAFLETLRRLPASAHLLSFRYDAGGKVVNIEGRAADYTLVSDFVATLAKQDLFREVRSEKTHLGPMEGRSVVMFSIKGTLR